MRIRLLFIGLVLLSSFGIAAAACGGSGFDSQSKVNSVRLFGVRADKPFAQPGETVTLEVLTTDARAEKRLPLKNYWIPIVCMNPREDLYYLCFLPSALTSGGGGAGSLRLVPPFPGDGGAPAAGASLADLPVGIDVSSFLPQGNSFSFRMPDDAIIARPGSPSYGLALVFNIACAGQVRLAERAGGSPQQIPIQCTDENGTPLTPNDYVIGINRVYAYADRTNTNPVVEKVTLDGVDIDPAKGITVERCVASRRDDCKAYKLDVRVSDASWEPNPDLDGQVSQREQVWVTYYATAGEFKNEARLLFDARGGRVSGSEVEYRAPNDAMSGTVWAVVHDNRAGAAFLTLPLRVQ